MYRECTLLNCLLENVHNHIRLTCENETRATAESISCGNNEIQILELLHAAFSNIFRLKITHKLHKFRHWGVYFVVQTKNSIIQFIIQFLNEREQNQTGLKTLWPKYILFFTKIDWYKFFTYQVRKMLNIFPHKINLEIYLDLK